MDSYNEEELKFEVYTNYLGGLASIISRGKYLDYSIDVDNNGLETLGNNTPNKIDIQKYLNNAWNSERILLSPKIMSADASFIKYSNHWSPVLGYYSIFLGYQALFISLRRSPILAYEPFLSYISSSMKKNRLPSIYPWHSMCDGFCFNNSENYNFGVDPLEVREFSSLSNPKNVPENVFIAKILKTTRSKQESYKITKSKQSGKIKTKKGTPKRLYNEDDKSRVLSSLHSTTLYDFLYRLRIRSNYEDADMYFLGERAEYSVRKYFLALCEIVDRQLFHLEKLIQISLSKKSFLTIADDYLSSGGIYGDGIAKRRQSY